MTKSLSSIWLLGWVLLSVAAPPQGTSGPALMSFNNSPVVYSSLGACEQAAQKSSDESRVHEVRPAGAKPDFFDGAVPLYPTVGYVCEERD